MLVLGAGTKASSTPPPSWWVGIHAVVATIGRPGGSFVAGLLLSLLGFWSVWIFPICVLGVCVWWCGWSVQLSVGT